MSIIHIKGKTRPRACGSTGNYECIGTDTHLNICKKCTTQHMIDTGEVVV